MKKSLLSFLIFNLCSFISFSQGVWTQKADFGGGNGWGSVAFSLGNRGYVGTGYLGMYSNQFWEFDPVNNTWTQKANFGGVARANAVGFSIGTKGYVGTGFYINSSSYYLNDFWEYDLNSNSWTRKADFGGCARDVAVGFSINNKGYIGTGFYKDSVNNYISLKDFWEYNPANDSWTQKADFAGGLRDCAVGFSIGSFGYLGTGEDDNGTFYNDIWQYSPSSNSWIPKASFSGNGRYRAVGFSCGTKGYIGTGSAIITNTFKKDFWEYNPSSNSWVNIISLPATSRDASFGLGIGSKAYVGGGADSSCLNYKDFWELTPPLGITESETKLEYTLYPNPMSESCEISLKFNVQSLKLVEFKLYDVQGNCVRNLKPETSNFKLERGNLSAGTYIYNITNENKTLASGKLIIQ